LNDKIEKFSTKKQKKKKSKSNGLTGDPDHKTVITS